MEHFSSFVGRVGLDSCLCLALAQTHTILSTCLNVSHSPEKKKKNYFKMAEKVMLKSCLSKMYHTVKIKSHSPSGFLIVLFP